MEVGVGGNLSIFLLPNMNEYQQPNKKWPNEIEMRNRGLNHTHFPKNGSTIFIRRPNPLIILDMTMKIILNSYNSKTVFPLCLKKNYTFPPPTSRKNKSLPIAPLKRIHKHIEVIKLRGETTKPWTIWKWNGKSTTNFINESKMKRRVKN